MWYLSMKLPPTEWIVSAWLELQEKLRRHSERKFHPPVVTPTGNDEDVNAYIKVRVENEDLCPRYCARVVKNIKIGPSPKWMQRRLASVVNRPINNLVDITNYVMEEYGQPMHAYDLDTIAGKEIVVRNAENGEKFTTLDGQERELDETVLMICDGEKLSELPELWEERTP